MQILWIIAILAAAYIVFFLLRKKNIMGGKEIIYNWNDNSAKEFRLELEMITDLAVKRAEGKIVLLEHLIAECQTKSEELDAKIKIASDFVHKIENVSGYLISEEDSVNNSKNKKKNFKRQIKPFSKKNSNQSDDILIGEKSLKDSLHNKEEFFNNEKYRAALAMLKEGRDVLDTAKITGLGKGEVMLLKELRDKK